MGCLLLSACAADGQLGGYFQENFSETPRCGATDKILTFANNSDQALVIEGIGFSAGTNGGGNFSIRGLQIGSAPEITPESTGGISEVTVRPQVTYRIRVRFNPLAETKDTPHTAILDIAYRDPTPGIIQFEVSGSSKGEANCPKPPVVGPVSLNGNVNLILRQLVASTSLAADKLSSDSGLRDFEPVVLTDTEVSEENGSITFPQITVANSFILPALDEAKAPQLAGFLEGDTQVTSAAEVDGKIDFSNGTIILEGLQVHFEDEYPSTIDMMIDLNTHSADIGIVSSETVSTHDFIMDGAKTVLGHPLRKDDGCFMLVGSTRVTQTSGQLTPADGEYMVARIIAQIECPEDNESCTFEAGNNCCDLMLNPGNKQCEPFI